MILQRSRLIFGFSGILSLLMWPVFDLLMAWWFIWGNRDKVQSPWPMMKGFARLLWQQNKIRHPDGLMVLWKTRIYNKKKIKYLNCWQFKYLTMTIQIETNLDILLGMIVYLLNSERHEHRTQWYQVFEWLLWQQNKILTYYWLLTWL